METDDVHVVPAPACILTPVPTTQTVIEIAKPAVSCQMGDTGRDVELVQRMLCDLGFDPGDIDGVFGDLLLSAVSHFQMYTGIDQSGAADAVTAAALYARWYEAQKRTGGNSPLKGCVIGIDPGHQRQYNDEQELISPHGSETKSKVSSGTYGRFTGVPEYVVNLQVAFKLRSALLELGAEVLMTRDTHDVDISNAQRAMMMNAAGVDCWLRIHANYNEDAAARGMFVLVPAEGSLNTDDEIVIIKSVVLAEALLKSTIEMTGANDLGIVPRPDQTGFCWSQVPVCNIEMGHLTNEQEDLLLVSEAYQQKIVKGLAEGFTAYFSDAEKYGW